MKLVLSLGMIGDFEVVADSDNYLFDAFAVGPTVLLAWPRHLFEFLVYPKVRNQNQLLHLVVRCLLCVCSGE